MTADDAHPTDLAGRVDQLLGLIADVEALPCPHSGDATYGVVWRDAIRAATERVLGLADEWVDELPDVDWGQITGLQYAVMVGVDDTDNAPTVLEVYDELATAEELAQHVPGSWIGRRWIRAGDWAPTTTGQQPLSAAATDLARRLREEPIDCPVDDPSCEGTDGQCHDACEPPTEQRRERP